ncbi:DUF4190 domain-containing protein [Chloroflexota bacterium]
MFCPMCGAPNEEDADFCGNCGAALSPDEVAEASEAPSESSEVVDEVLADGPAVAAAAEAEAIDETVAESTEIDAAARDAEPEMMEVAPPPPPRATYSPPAAVSAGVPTSGMAIAALVTGIVGLTIFPLLGSILALVLGYMARNDIRRRPDEVSGDGLALAGIVMGWIAVGLTVLGLLVFGGITVCSLCGLFGAGGSY